jgi:hypothetical protein
MRKAECRVQNVANRPAPHAHPAAPPEILRHRKRRAGMGTCINRIQCYAYLVTQKTRKKEGSILR